MEKDFRMGRWNKFHLILIQIIHGWIRPKWEILSSYPRGFTLNTARISWAFPFIIYVYRCGYFVKDFVLKTKQRGSKDFFDECVTGKFATRWHSRGKTLFVNARWCSKMESSSKLHQNKNFVVTITYKTFLYIASVSDVSNFLFFINLMNIYQK